MVSMGIRPLAPINHSQSIHNYLEGIPEERNQITQSELAIDVPNSELRERELQDEVSTAKGRLRERERDIEVLKLRIQELEGAERHSPLRRSESSPVLLQAAHDKLLQEKQLLETDIKSLLTK